MSYFNVPLRNRKRTYVLVLLGIVLLVIAAKYSEQTYEFKSVIKLAGLTLSKKIKAAPYFGGNENANEVVDNEEDWEMDNFENSIKAATTKEPLRLKNLAEYNINTPGCTLPRTDIMPSKFKMKKSFKPFCKDYKHLATVNPKSHVLQLQPNFIGNNSYTCTVTELTRSNKGDSHKIGATINVTRTLNLKETELFVTKCGNYTEFEATFPLKAQVKEKLKFWEDQAKNKNDDDESAPYSVLFVGFDTTSRSHFFRSIPKTLKIMQQSGFIDFKGYHSVVPYTLENFLAFLMGLTTPQLRSRCAESWSTPFDKCPIIFKDYNFNKFITMYTEDGSQTFNWGGGGGFIRPPTDYYTHPLFTALDPFRKGHQLPPDGSCMSRFSAPQFMLDYTRRFFQKFKNVPFFSFTWFANPFHDYTYALHGFDESLAEFFTALQSSQEILKRTMIVLVSDHGERLGSFVNKGYEGFLEKSLPGLFIRLPDLLVQRRPELQLKQILRTNTRRLTTGFDIHQTFMHLLILGGLNVSKETSIAEFQPVLRDRSSLFLPVSEYRNCEDVNIRPGNCVCNSSLKAAELTNNPFYTNKMINFALDEMNSIIDKSKYNNSCHRWSKPMLALISNHRIANTTNSTDTVLRFMTNRRGEFEVKIRYFHDANGTKLNSTDDRFERISNFSRINLYKKDSACVGFETDEDKLMKEICYCRPKPEATKQPAAKQTTRPSNKTKTKS